MKKIVVAFCLLLALASGLIAPAHAQSGSISVTDYGALCDGSTDDTTAINSAIATAQVAASARGSTATVAFPAGNCNVAGTVQITGSGVTLAGVGMFHTIINCTGAGTADCVTVGAQASQIATPVIRDMRITAPSRTGGNCLQINNVRNALVSRVNLFTCWNGFLDTITNNVTVEHSLFNVANGAYEAKWSSPANNIQRSDVLTFFDTSINPGYTAGADCIDLDGMVQTLHLTNVVALQCNYGLRIQNTAASNSFYPAFVYTHDLEIEGAKSASVRIDAGHTISFTNSDFYNFHGATGQGNADADCVIINPDTGFSNTHNIRFTAGRIGGCNNRAANINAQQVHMVDVQLTSISQAGAGVSPAIEVGANASEVNLLGISTYFQGDVINASYALTVDNGASVVTFQGDCKGAISGCINNPGHIPSLLVLPGFDQNGAIFNAPISLLAFGAKCDGVTDDSAAIQAWLNYGTSHANSRIVAPAGTCVFTSALTAVGNQYALEGAGPYQTIFLYTGASTTIDLMTFGNGGSANRLFISGFTIRSNTLMTAGAAMHFIGVTRSYIQNVNYDGQDGNGNLFHGVWFDGADNVHLSYFEAKGQGEALRVNGTATGKSDLFVHNCKIGSFAIGVHIGGNFGGFTLDDCDVVNNGTNMVIDQALNATANRELFFGKGAFFDSASTGPGVSISDTGTGFVFFTGTWIASSHTHGIAVASGVNMTIVYDGGTIFNNQNDGINDATNGTTQYNIAGTRIAANGRSGSGFGINALNANPKIAYNGILFTQNQSGNTSTNILTTSTFSDAAALRLSKSITGLGAGIALNGPGVTCAASVGTGAACALSGGTSPNNGTVAITAGTGGPVTSGNVTITFSGGNMAGSNAPVCVAGYDNTGASWLTAGAGVPVVSAISLSAVTFAWNATTGLASGSTYRLLWHCFGK